MRGEGGFVSALWFDTRASRSESNFRPRQPSCGAPTVPTQYQPWSPVASAAVAIALSNVFSNPLFFRSAAQRKPPLPGAPVGTLPSSEVDRHLPAAPFLAAGSCLDWTAAIRGRQGLTRTWVRLGVRDFETDLDSEHLLPPRPPPPCARAQDRSGLFGRKSKTNGWKASPLDHLSRHLGSSITDRRAACCDPRLIEKQGDSRCV